MTLDDATRQIYRRTDSATLIGLLPELRRLGKAAQKERERLAHEPSEDVSADDRFIADLSAYIAVTLERDLWIRNELKRRGLLPTWPGEEATLQNDA